MAPSTRNNSRRGNCDVYKTQAVDELMQSKANNVLTALDKQCQEKRKEIMKHVNLSIMRIKAETQSLLNKLPKDMENIKIDDLIGNLNNDHTREHSFATLTNVLTFHEEVLVTERAELTDKLLAKSKSNATGQEHRPRTRGASAKALSSKTVVKSSQEKSSLPIKKTTHFKKGKKENRRLTRTLTQQQALKNFHSLGDITKEDRAFSAIKEMAENTGPSATGQDSKMTKSLPSLVRRPHPRERIFLVSEGGTPLSNLDAWSMPTFLLPLQDGSNIAISRADEFNSLGHDAQMQLRLVNQKFSSLFRRVPVVK